MQPNIEFKYYKLLLDFDSFSKKENNSYDYLGTLLSINFNYTENDIQKTINMQFLNYLLIDKYLDKIDVRFSDIRPFDFNIYLKKDNTKKIKSITMEDNGVAKFKLIKSKEYNTIDFNDILHLINQYLNSSFNFIEDSISFNAKFKLEDLEKHKIEVINFFNNLFESSIQSSDFIKLNKIFEYHQLNDAVKTIDINHKSINKI